MEPLDTNQFTQQLVQFASVEQQIKSNETTALGRLLRELEVVDRVDRHRTSSG